MKHPQIEAVLEPRVGHRVALVLRNASDRVAWLYKPNACLGGHIENNVFRIHEGEKAVRYTGIYVKRPAPRPEDFIELPAHGSRIEEIDLAAAYALSAGTRYALRYEAFHDNPDDPKSLWEVASPEVIIGGGSL